MQGIWQCRKIIDQNFCYVIGIQFELSILNTYIPQEDEHDVLMWVASK